jgi:hypothetical protein
MASALIKTSFYARCHDNDFPVTGLKVGACYDYADLTSQAPSGSNLNESRDMPLPSAAMCHAQVTEKLSAYVRGEYQRQPIAAPLARARLSKRQRRSSMICGKTC